MKYDVRPIDAIEHEQELRKAEAREKYGLWPAGEYAFEVIDAKEKTSKNGNEMIELNLSVFNDQGNGRGFFDFLVSHLPDKIYFAASAMGMSDKYLSGSLLPHDFIGKSGKLHLGSKREEYNGEMRTKNVIKYYVQQPHKTPSVQSAHSNAKANAYVTQAAPIDDKIPW